MQVHFDRFAILLSGICAIHCVALPIIASLIPMLAITIQHGYELHEFWFHHFILIFILPISVIALIMGYRVHRHIVPVIISGVGLLILVGVAVFAGYLISNHLIPHDGEMIVTVFGGLIHAVGHLLNLMASRRFHKTCAVKG